MNTRQVLELLRRYESPNVTFVEADGSWPIVWKRAKGVHVWDADGRKYVDLTAAFGVAVAGHANPVVVRAGQLQMSRLLHAMGDVHPHELKANLARELSRLTFERWALTQSKVQSLKSKVQGPKSKVQSPKSKASTAPRHGKVIFCNSGFEAVEAALKTAMLATGKPGVIAFEGAYHGVGYGALNTTHREHFRGPFRSQLAEFGYFVAFPVLQSVIRGPISLKVIESSIRQLFRRKRIGAILVEPIQVRGGINIPPPEFLPMLRNLCDEHKALLILDEIYTGFGRTGSWFACEHTGIAPDLICLGKALTGGFPLSACVGRADLMDAAWPRSTGEAIHTSTFLGHPVGCAMALENILQIQRQNLIQRSHELGAVLLESLQSPNLKTCRQLRAGRFSFHPRGLGLLAGVEFSLKNGKAATAIALEVNKRMLHRGFIMLPEGKDSEVLSLTPPLTIEKSQLKSAVAALEATLVSLGD